MGEIIIKGVIYLVFCGLGLTLGYVAANIILLGNIR